MKNIQIKYNPVSDSRSLTFVPSKEEVLLGRELHKENVKNALNKFCDFLRDRFGNHDWSIDETIEEYYTTVIDAYNSKDPEYFRNTPWYKNHGTLEKHHCEEFQTPEDDLIDIIETIFDSVIRAKERGDESKVNTLDKDYVYQCFLNTIKYLNDKIEVTL